MTELKKSKRDLALDWIKGALVVLMVIYHSLNYSPYSPVAFRYLAFLPPSFILVAGYLLTNSYLARYDVRDWRLHQRLLTRGAKLVVLFTFLNLGLYLMAFGANGPQQLAYNAVDVFFATSANAASFYIIVAIGYFLILSPALIALCARGSWIIPVLSIVLFIICSVLDFRRALPYHISMITAGITGMAFGLLPAESIIRTAKNLILVVPFYLAYRLCSHFAGDPYPVQLMGVVAGLLLLYALALRLKIETNHFRHFVLLGRYSLWGYIVQLAIIQVLVRMFGVPDSAGPIIALTVAALLFTWLSTLLVHLLRAKARFVEVTYKIVFA